MKCRYCGKDAKIELITSYGETGVYYLQKCTNCGVDTCSDIMRSCNGGSWCGMISHMSYDKRYFVYSEEYVRETMKDSYEYALWKAGR